MFRMILFFLAPGNFPRHFLKKLLFELPCFIFPTDVRYSTRRQFFYIPECRRGGEENTNSVRMFFVRGGMPTLIIYKM